MPLWAEADNVRAEEIEFVFMICLRCGGQSEIVLASKIHREQPFHAHHLQPDPER